MEKYFRIGQNFSFSSELPLYFEVKFYFFKTLKIMLHKEKPKRKKNYRRETENETRPKRKMKRQKIKYRHSKVWLTEEE